MEFLHKTLADAPFRRIWRQCLESLQDLLYREVLLRQDYTTLGATRFARDVAAIQSLTDVFTSRAGAGNVLGMPKLMEAATLLSLPIEAGANQMSLAEASKEIFATNKQAIEALESLGIYRLTNYEARSILARRVEANGD